MGITNSTYNALKESEKELLLRAQETMFQAYNIYSGFFVGAAVLTREEEIFTGACMENASYGLTSCAEVCAIQSAFSNGYRNITTIAIIGGKDPNKEGDPVSPCGRCRQIIFEASQVAGENIVVILSDPTFKKIIRTTINDLMPLPFGPQNIGFEDGLKTNK
jgi:cytidine deaminase